MLVTGSAIGGNSSEGNRYTRLAIFVTITEIAYFLVEKTLAVGVDVGVGLGNQGAYGVGWGVGGTTISNDSNIIILFFFVMSVGYLAGSFEESFTTRLIRNRGLIVLFLMHNLLDPEDIPRAGVIGGQLAGK